METVVIVGAGPSGLVTAYHLKRRGIACTLLERGPAPGATFARMRPTMHLVSPPFFSELPDVKLPEVPTGFPTMPEFHAYLTRFAAHHRLDVRCGTEVLAARRAASGEGFDLDLTGGSTLSTRVLVCATGIYSTPYVPPELTLERCTIPWQHSADYQAPGALAGRDVLVVGAGLSAQEIALELCAHAPVAMSSRLPLRWVPNPLLGLDLHWWAWLPEMVPVALAEWFVPLAREPASGTPIRLALKSGRIRVVPGVKHLDGATVHFDDGSTARPEALVLATGFRPTVRWLAGLAHAEGQRIADTRDAESRAHPGLYFVGFPFLRTFASRYLRGIRRDAAHVAGAIARRVG